jgi:hypothetical protein
MLYIKYKIMDKKLDSMYFVFYPDPCGWTPILINNTAFVGRVTKIKADII